MSVEGQAAWAENRSREKARQVGLLAKYKRGQYPKCLATTKLSPGATYCGLPVLLTPSGVMCCKCGGGVDFEGVVEDVPLIHEVPEWISTIIAREGYDVPAPDWVTPLETSGQLADELDRSKQEERQRAADEVEEKFFGKPAPSMGDGYERITTRMFHLNPEAEYDWLEKNLRLPFDVAGAEYGKIAGHLNEVEHNAYRAFVLYVNAREALESYTIDCMAIEAAMRDAATLDLQSEKDDGKRTKAITDKDIETRMSSKYPDEYRSISTRRVRARKMVDACERLAELWKFRSKTLAAIADKSR